MSASISNICEVIPGHPDVKEIIIKEAKFYSWAPIAKPRKFRHANGTSISREALAASAVYKNYGGAFLRARVEQVYGENALSGSRQNILDAITLFLSEERIFSDEGK